MLIKVLTKSSTSPPSSSPAASSLALSLGARNYKQEVGHNNKMNIFVFVFYEKNKQMQKGSETQGMGSLVPKQD